MILLGMFKTILIRRVPFAASLLPNEEQPRAEQDLSQDDKERPESHQLVYNNQKYSLKDN